MHWNTCCIYVFEISLCIKFQVIRYAEPEGKNRKVIIFSKLKKNHKIIKKSIAPKPINPQLTFRFDGRLQV